MAETKTLLDNAGQGFLTFDKDFLIDEEYSKECEKLLGKDLVQKDIATILFPDVPTADFFKDDCCYSRR